MTQRIQASARLRLDDTRRAFVRPTRVANTPRSPRLARRAAALALALAVVGCGQGDSGAVDVVGSDAVLDARDDGQADTAATADDATDSEDANPLPIDVADTDGAAADPDTTVPDTAADPDTTVPDTTADTAEGPDTTTDVPDMSAGDAFAPVIAELEASYADLGVSGVTLVVRDSSDQPVLVHTIGTHTPSTRVAVASASKLVSALVLLRLVELGQLSLSTTTADTLGWQGDIGTITLDQLGGFVSGLTPVASCTSKAGWQLADCVDAIRDLPTAAMPGATFRYSNIHLQVAAGMAEAVTGEPWRDLVKTVLFEPLGLTEPGLRFVTFPKQNFGTTNPLVAGGLRATTNEYLQLLALAFHGGLDSAGGTRWLAESLAERLHNNPFSQATVAYSPYTNTGLGYRYGFGSWLECGPPAASCDRVSSTGKFGFAPWFDQSHGYYAVLSMESDADDAATLSVELQHRLMPLIEAALSAL